MQNVKLICKSLDFYFLYLIIRTLWKIIVTLELYGDEPELYQLYRYSRNGMLTTRGWTIPKSIREENDEVGAPIRASGRRWKVVAGRQSAVFSFGRIARHPAVNPGRGDKPGDELVDATGSLVLIVRLLLVRVIPPVPIFWPLVLPSRSHPCSPLLPLCHSLVASSAAHLFSLASPGRALSTSFAL
jgi:hypothetical protein